MRTVAVVGTSLAGLRAIETLRREGFDGRIVAIGAEPHLPYDRPPLSKELLAGTARAGRDRAAQAGRRRPRSRLGPRHRARRRSTSARASSTLADDTRVAFDGLVLATGSTPRLLPNQPELATRTA